MAAVWYRFRAELRTRWKSLFAVAFLVGLAGGIVLTAVAGARRTDSAYRRYIEQSDAWDVLVNPDAGDDTELSFRDVATLPGVEALGVAVGVSAFPLDASAEQLEEPLQLAIADRRLLHEFARPNVLRGRMPNPDRPDEVLVDVRYAELFDVAPGDRVPSVAAGFEEVLTATGGSYSEIPEVLRGGAVGERIDLVVTGVGVTPDTLTEDEGFAFPYMFLTPAFLEAHPSTRAGFSGAAVQLERGAADETEFRAAVERLVPDETIEFQSRERIDEAIGRAVRPYTIALWAFAIAVGATGLLVIGQAFARQRVLDAVDDASLIAIGFARRQLLGLSLLRAAAVGVAGTALAIGVAIVASPLMPIGPARDAEPHRGVAVDAVVLGFGAAALFVTVLGLALVSAWRLLWTSASDIRPSSARLSRLLARNRLKPSASAGIRSALEPGSGRTAVPARTTLATAGLAVAMVIAALTFAASLDRLIDTPRLYGVGWQLQVELDGETDQEVAEQGAELERALGAERDVVGWSRLAAGRVELNHRPIPAGSFEARRGGVEATIVEGRLPNRATEVALGARTLSQLDVRVGDHVTARFRGRQNSMTVVGKVVLPALGNYPGGDKTQPGDGALLTPAGLDEWSPPFLRDGYFVRIRPGVSTASVAERLRGELDPELFIISDPNRPADVVDLERVRATPLVLAVMLAVLGAATLAHALVTTVRRRRRDFALLKTLGFNRGQVGATVAWQASTVALVAVAVGLPLGIALGRWAWIVLARNVGFVAEPGVAQLALVLALPVLLIVVNLVAAVPGRIAARTPPAVVLRSE